MSDLLDTLLFETPSSEEREALRDRFNEQPGLAEAWAHWQEVRATFRDRLQERVSDRRLLVLYVLEADGYDEALTTSEQAALEAARSDISHAIDTIPALEQVVERIREEQTDFETVWNAQFEDEEARPSESKRSDRSARPPTSQDASASRWTRRFALASLVIGIAVGIGALWFQGASTTTVTVNEGETRVIELGTGTTARLVGTARLTHPTSAAKNAPYSVTLNEGRAFFNVQPRTDGEAFVVETPSATASVLGTQFGVTARPDTTEVVLASGTVQVGADETVEEPETVVLEPGQRSVVAKGDAPSAPTVTDLTAALDWTGLFVFRSVSMETVTDRLSRHYEVSIAVPEELAQEPVTGTFERDQPAQQVLNALAATLGAQVKQQEEVYRFELSR